MMISTVLAALATMLASLGLWPLFEDLDWLFPVLTAVALAAVVGAAARRARLPHPAVMSTQLLALLLLVTATHTPGTAFLGVIPTPASMTELVRLIDAGAAAANNEAVPVSTNPGLVLLVTLGIGVAAIEVDFTAVTCRCPALSGLVLLVVYAVPALVLPDGAPWTAFVAAAAGWLLVLYDGQRNAAREWGTPIGAGAVRAGDPRVLLGQRAGIGALLGAVVIAALLPGIGEGRLERFGPPTDPAGVADARSVNLELDVTLARNLRSSATVPLLSYVSTSGEPQYLRMTVLDTFDGVRWVPTENDPADPTVYEALPYGWTPGALADDDGLDRTSITPTGSARTLRYLPSPYDAQKIDTSGDWRWNAETSTIYSDSAELGINRYAIWSDAAAPDPEELAASTSLRNSFDRNLVVPTDLPSTVAATAREVVAGSASDYARLVALQGWFRSNFTYDLDVPAATDPNAISAFLTDRVGYCQHFAATFALMARTLGIPARVVVGFAPGARDFGANSYPQYTVTNRDFHAWPEVRLGDAGWVRFEPTPRTGSDSTVDVPTWTLPGPLTSAEPAPTATAAPSPQASTPARPEREPADASVAQDRGPAVLDVRQVAGWAVLVLVLLVMAAAPSVLRMIRRRRRLSFPAGPDGIEAAWAELADTARDLDLDWPTGDTPRRTAAAFVEDAALVGPGADAVGALRQDLERARYARRGDGASRSPGAAHPTPPAAAVREIRAEVLRTRDRSTRWRALLLPRTMFDALTGRRN